MQLIPVPALESNYIWLLIENSGRCIIVDPGDAIPVLSKIKSLRLRPEAILLTHFHHDHTAGVRELVKYYPDIPVAGPSETLNQGANQIITEGDNPTFGPFHFSLLSVPGHTPQHIAYYLPPYLFCGDVLFSAGCGRLFAPTDAEQMYHSLQKIAQLPDNTVICCAHEYTLQNLEFARSILTDDEAITQYQQQVEQLREQGQPSLPTLLKTEKAINLFLRCNEEMIKKSLFFNESNVSDHEVFALLRRKKDTF